MQIQVTETQKDQLSDILSSFLTLTWLREGLQPLKDSSLVASLEANNSNALSGAWFITGSQILCNWIILTVSLVRVINWWRQTPPPPLEKNTLWPKLHWGTIAPLPWRRLCDTGLPSHCLFMLNAKQGSYEYHQLLKSFALSRPGNRTQFYRLVWKWWSANKYDFFASNDATTRYDTLAAMLND